MKRVLGTAVLVLCAGGLLASCGDGGDSPAPLRYTVDAATGNDNVGDGVSIPYRTITKAVSMARFGDTVTVRVAPGTYDNALGEIFPIFVPTGMTLIGDEANKGNGAVPTLILGGGLAREGGRSVRAAVIPLGGSTIAGFTISNNDPIVDACGIFLNHDLVTLRNNRIDNTARGHGVYVWGGNQSVVSGNEIVNNYYFGLLFGTESGTLNRVENNIVRGNGRGILCGAPVVDLGGGPAGSVGGNIIAGNGSIDLQIDSSAGTVYATDNFWDHVPPNVITDFMDLGPETDIVKLVTGARIDWTGAALAP